jgi:predicted DCC family thiol-disulfide oxidoreductase YuxK
VRRRLRLVPLEKSIMSTAQSNRHMNPERSVVFFDGTCGFCSATVQWVAAHDRRQEFWFAPLFGETFSRRVPAQLVVLPDSVVIVTSIGRVLTQGQAITHVLTSIGKPWRIVGLALRCLPGALVDSVYDWFAAHRRKLAPTDNRCPVIPYELGQRLLP